MVLNPWRPVRAMVSQPRVSFTPFTLPWAEITPAITGRRGLKTIEIQRVLSRSNQNECEYYARFCPVMICTNVACILETIYIWVYPCVSPRFAPTYPPR